MSCLLATIQSRAIGGCPGRLLGRWPWLPEILVGPPVTQKEVAQTLIGQTFRLIETNVNGQETAWLCVMLCAAHLLQDESRGCRHAIPPRPLPASCPVLLLHPVRGTAASQLGVPVARNCANTPPGLLVDT